MKNIKNNSILMLFLTSAVIVLLISVMVGKMMVASSDMIEESTRHEMAALSLAASLLTDAETLDRFRVPGDMADPEYPDLREKLGVFAEASGLLYAYYMRYDPETGLVQYIVDNIRDGDEGIRDDLDTPPIETEDMQLEALLSGETTVDFVGEYAEGWDGVISAWTPMYYADGTPSGIVACVDMLDTYIRVMRTNTYLLMFVLTVALALVLTTGLFNLSLYRKKATQAEVASEAKSSFLSRISHEMRTPMNAIIGLCKMAISYDDLDEVRETLKTIETSSEHLRRVVDDVLDISKIESGRMELEFVPVILREELKKIERIIRPQADLKQQRFEIIIDESVPEAVYYDSVHIHQIAVNLLGNAIKFTPPGGEISLSVAEIERRGSHCCLEWRVRDNGIGIDEESRARVFLPFEQADVSTTRKYGGTGLGLSISRQLVEMMGGEIRVESAPGEGSEFIFTIWLELSDKSAALAGTETEADPIVDLTGRCILLVEDSEINQLIAADVLLRYGAEIDTAENGLVAVEKFTAAPTKYALIFMDIQMPVMDGYEAARSIRDSAAETAKSVPIVALTANAFKEDVDRAFAAGMDGHIKKPFEPREIEAIIAKLLPECRK